MYAPAETQHGNTVDPNIEHNKNGVRAYTRLGWAFLVFLLSMVGLTTLIITILSFINPAILESQFFGMPFNYICMYLVGFPVMLLILRKTPSVPAWPKAAPKKKLGIVKLLMLYPVSYAILTVFAMATTWLESLFGKSGTVTTDTIINSGMSPWIPFVFGAIIAPIMEEIVCRGLTYNKASAYGKGMYVFWSATMFGLFHLNFGQSVYAFFFGLFVAHIMYETGSVLNAIVLHMLVNLTGGVGIGGLVMRSGNETVHNIYAWYVTILLIVGCIIGVTMAIMALVKKIKSRAANSGEQPPAPAVAAFTNKKRAFLNPGTILYILICLGFIILAFL